LAVVRVAVVQVTVVLEPLRSKMFSLAIARTEKIQTRQYVAFSPPPPLISLGQVIRSERKLKALVFYRL